MGSPFRLKEVFITTVEKGIAKAVEEATLETAAGQYDNAPFVGVLANEGVGLAPYHDWESKVPAELTAEVDALKQQIIDGAIVVESANSPKA